MATTTILLKDHTVQGLAASADFASAAKLTAIPSNALPAAQITFRNTGTAGFWYIALNRTTGPTTTNYSIKLGPGEFYTEDNPPIGEIWALADGAVNGPLSFYGGWN